MGKKFSRLREKDMVAGFDMGMSATQIAKAMGLHTTSVTRVLKRNGREMRKIVGDQHPSWRGGKIIKSGYPATYAPDHPRRMNIPYVYDHILVMEKAIGRVPAKSEPIHHIDLDKKNCDINNLYLCKNHKEHGEAHASLERVAAELVKKGVIRFKNGKYYI